MKYSLSIRLLALFSFLMVILSVLTGVLVNADGFDPGLLSTIELPSLEEALALLAALDVSMVILLACLISLIFELLFGCLRLTLPRILLRQGRQLLFDHGSRAPPRYI